MTDLFGLGRILILSGSQRNVLPAIQALRADKSNAGVREPTGKKEWNVRKA